MCGKGGESKNEGGEGELYGCKLDRLSHKFVVLIYEDSRNQDYGSPQRDFNIILINSGALPNTSQRCRMPSRLDARLLECNIWGLWYPEYPKR
jgi:hypothetical protein